MAKKIEKLDEPIKLTKEQFWKWNGYIEKMTHGETKLKLVRLQGLVSEKDLEILRLKIALFRQNIQIAEENYNNYKAEYEEVKKQLETELGLSLNGCSIDEITLEIHKLD